MNHRAAFWTMLDENGMCRLCTIEAFAYPLVDMRRVITSGHATAVRNALVNHCRVWHPEAVKLLPTGGYQLAAEAA